MKKRIFLLSIAVACALTAAGCVAAQPTAAPAAAVPALTAEPTQAPTVALTPAATPTPEATEPADEEPLPMKLDCAIPSGFAIDTDNSTASMSVYVSDVAAIRLGYEASTDQTATPDGFKASILASLPREPNADGFKLVSCEASNFDSYPGFIIQWTTGANEDTWAHEARFILTDGYNYRAEYAVSANSQDDKATEMKAFFDSVKLQDAD